ncbi:MAG: 2'-5' RNA ligase family protein [Chloroflexia bacterium]|nr:2'-5' RNA ligase family protein [Chloroflexia bacterium]
MHTGVIELFLDNHAEAAVRDLWLTLSRLLGTPRLDAYGMRPHVTLLAGSQLHTYALRPLLSAIAATTPPFEISFATAATFLARDGIVFLAPTPTLALLQIQQTLYHAVVATGISVGSHYTPEMWIPHCTLAVGLTDAQAARAIAICREYVVAIYGRIVALGAVDIRLEQPYERYVLSLCGGAGPSSP